MAEKYRINVGGTELNIFADEDAEYVNSLVAEINDKLNGMMLRNTRYTKLETLILASMEFLDSRKKLEAEIDRLEKENEFLRKRIH